MGLTVFTKLFPAYISEFFYTLFFAKPAASSVILFVMRTDTHARIARSRRERDARTFTIYRAYVSIAFAIRIAIPVSVTFIPMRVTCGITIPPPLPRFLALKAGHYSTREENQKGQESHFIPPSFIRHCRRNPAGDFLRATWEFVGALRDYKRLIAGKRRDSLRHCRSTQPPRGARAKVPLLTLRTRRAIVVIEQLSPT